MNDGTLDPNAGEFPLNAGELGDEDLQYLVGWFEDFGPFWMRAAAAGARTGP